MTPTTAVAPLTVESSLPQIYFCEEMPYTAAELSVELDELACGFYPTGTRCWESGLLVATMIRLSRESNDSNGRWIGFELTNPDHWMAIVVQMGGKFRHAPLCANGAIDVTAIVESAASDLGRAGYIETKTIAIPGDEENEATPVVVIFPTANLVKELDNHYGHKG